MDDVLRIQSVPSRREPTGDCQSFWQRAQHYSARTAVYEYPASVNTLADRLCNAIETCNPHERVAYVRKLSYLCTVIQRSGVLFRRYSAALGVPDVTAGCGGESMEKAIDFCFRTGGTAGSVVTTQIAIVRPMPPNGISSAYLPNAPVSCARGFQPRVRDSINRPSLGDFKRKKNQKRKINRVGGVMASL